MSSNQCLLASPLVGWCNYSQWHGNTVNFGARDIFGYVQSSGLAMDGYNNNNAPTKYRGLVQLLPTAAAAILCGLPLKTVDQHY